MMPPNRPSYSHILVTRFSYRGYVMPRSFDPLDPAVLSGRFGVFEATCLPSVLGQTCKDFAWVLLVDEMLPSAFRSRLEDLVTGHANTFLHHYSEELRLGNLDWLVPYAADSRDRIVSTWLDDDDMLCADFVAHIQAHLAEIKAQGGLPRFLLMACRNALQWDMVAKRNAPLGYLKPWRRRTPDGRYYPPNSGFSALSDYPDTNLSIYQFGHYLARFYFADDEAVAKLRIEAQERVQQVRAELMALGIAPKGEVMPAEEEVLHWIPGDAPQVLVVNHGANKQVLRLFSDAQHRVKVDGPASFAGFAVDLAAAARYMEKHRTPWSHPLRQLRHIMWLKFSTSLPSSITSRVYRLAKHHAARLRDLVSPR